jgi:hypothetical protein
VKRVKKVRKAKKSLFQRMVGKLGKTLKDHLLPHPGNKHTPHVLRHKTLFSMSVLMVLMKTFVIGAGIALPAASLYSSAITPTNIISLTNATRENLGLEKLSENDKLSISAQMKAEDMLENQYFAHTSPNGVTPWSWFGEVGYKYRFAGENLAVYFTEAEDVHAGWLASPTHKANIVDTRYAEIGVGVAQGNYNGYPAIFVVQHFGYPAAGTIAAPVPEAPVEKEVALALEAPPQESAVLSAKSSGIEEVSVRPEAGGNAYSVSLKANDAETVTAHLGTESATLKKSWDGNWEGSLPYNADSLSENGEQLYVVALGGENEVVEPIAIAAPETTTSELYGFDQPKNEAKLFGFIKIGNLDDNVKQFYIISIVVIASVLLLTLLAKFHLERLPLLGHSLAVIAIAVLLTVI